MLKTPERFAVVLMDATPENRNHCVFLVENAVCAIMCLLLLRTIGKHKNEFPRRAQVEAGPLRTARCCENDLLQESALIVFPSLCRKLQSSCIQAAEGKASSCFFFGVAFALHVRFDRSSSHERFA